MSLVQRDENAPFGVDKFGFAYKQPLSKWMLFMKDPSNVGLTMREKRAKYYGVPVSSISETPSKKRTPSVCVKKTQSHCLEPCRWSPSYPRKNGSSVRPHCRMPLGSPSGRKYVSRWSSPSGCRSLQQPDCTKPCSWTKATSYKSKITGNTVNRKAYCAYRYNTMKRPESADEVHQMRGTNKN